MISGTRNPEPGTAAHHDTRLARFLDAPTDDDAEAALTSIFDDATERLLVESVRRGLSGSARGRIDIEDVASETRVRLIRRLWTLRRERSEPIEDFNAYVATTATRTCYAHLRARFPARTRFRNQVRYSVTRHPQTLLESTADGVWQCRSRALRLAASDGALARSGAQEFLSDPAAFLAQHRIDRGQPIAPLIAALLAKLDGAIELDRLVDALALVLGISDQQVTSGATTSDVHAIERVPDPAPDTTRELADRQALGTLWSEVVSLPINQRMALLLNLRDPDGGSALHALPETGLVTRDGLARLLDMPEADLAAIWNELPLEDLAIAARIGLTRQQVINLRKSARARLARRTK